MAPKQATKRGRPTGKAEPQPKKIREDPNIVGVREALEQAGVSPSVKQMMLACLPNCLGVPAAERHATQTTVINMIKEVLDGVTSKLQDAVEGEKAKVVDIDRQKEGLQVALDNAQAALVAVEEDAQTKDTALAEASTAVAVAKEALYERQEAHREADGALLQAKGQQAAIQKALTEDFQAIVEGRSSSYQQILEHLQGITLDESLLSALPKTCVKAMGERGPFDTMVLDQLKSVLVGQEAEQAKLVKDAEPAAAERTEAIRAAQADLDSATAASRKAAEVLAEASKNTAPAKAAVEEAQKALDDFGPTFAEATKVRDQKALDLDNWTGYNMGCFEILAA